MKTSTGFARPFALARAWDFAIGGGAGAGSGAISTTGSGSGSGTAAGGETAFGGSATVVAVRMRFGADISIQRLRAAKLAGLSEIPIVLRKVTDQEQFVIALIENIQREDLNPIEEARAYRRLMNEFDLTQEALASRIGKGRVVIANTLRLLSLPEHIQIAVSEGAISAGHARSLVSIGDAKAQEEAAERILKENLTVRDVEKIVSDWKEALKTGRVSSPLRKDPQVRELENSLEQTLGTKVAITSRGKAPDIKGQVKLSYFSLSDLERLVEILQK
jgi:ParB family chromosome partitioning protein